MTALVLLVVVASASERSPGERAFTAALVLDLHQDGVYAGPEQVRQAHADACAAGEPLACDPSWAPGDLTAAAAAMEGPCAGGHLVACMVLGWRDAQTEPGTYDAQAPQAADAPARFRLGCDGGLERACVEWAALLQLGVGVPKDEAAALPIHQTACQVGELSGCRRLGSLYHAGLGVDRDLSRARQYYAQACEGGMLGGCNSLGLLAHLALDGTSDPAAAAALYIQACDGGHRSACSNLEKLYARGMRPADDPEGTLALWEAGCDRGVPVACANGADLAVDPLRGDRVDPAKATALRERGCALDDPYSCGALGRELLPTDHDRAASLLTPSCEAGIVESCLALSEVVSDRKSPHHDVEAAARLDASACVNGFPPACASLADALWRGVGADRDRDKARELYGRACDGGVVKACRKR